MEEDPIIYETDGEIGRITLNRPDKLNALNMQLLMRFVGVLDEIEMDDNIKVVIIKGAGRGFSAGFDLEMVYKVYGGEKKESKEKTRKERPNQRTRLIMDRTWTGWNQKLLLFPKVTIAQVHGNCIGEGSTIAEACDITMVADDAKISHAEQRLGFAGSGENLVPLFQMLGYKKARWMVITGDTINGKEAERIGWATKSVPFDELEEETTKIAKKVALLPRDGLAIGKASNNLIYDVLGISAGWAPAYVTHTLFTNLKFEPDEFNFIKTREKKSASVGFHERDKRYEEAS